MAFSHSQKYMAWLHGTAGTGRTGTGANPLLIQKQQETLRLYSLYANVHIAGKSIFLGCFQRIHPGYLYSWYLFQKPSKEQLLKLPFSFLSFHHGSKGLLCSLSKTYDSGNIFRTGTKAPLLSSPMKEGRKTNTLSNHQKSNTLGPMKLVGTGGKQVYPHFRKRQWNLPKGLHRIRMKEHPMLFRNFSDSPQILNRSHFIVSRHDGNQNRILCNRLLQGFQIQKSLPIHRNPADSCSQTFRKLAAFQNSMMLYGRTDNMGLSLLLTCCIGAG